MPYPWLTARLSISPLDERDVADFVAYRRDPEVARWQSWDVDYDTADAMELIASQPVSELPGQGEWIQLGVRDRGEGRLYGDVAVHRVADQPDTFELGVTLARASQGRGIAQEALSTVLAELFTTHGAHRVIAGCDARNAPVARLLRRVGLRQESSQLEADFFKGEWTTLDGYAMLAREHAELVRIRPATAADAEAIAEVYLAAVHAELPFLRLAHSDEQVRQWFRDSVLPTSTVLVAVEHEQVVGFAAVRDGSLDHLYLRPDRLRRGIGTSLVQQAKAVSPAGLTLFVFQLNWPARAFYRRHGFRPTAFGSGAGNDEREPDLAMVWRPER